MRFREAIDGYLLLVRLFPFPLLPPPASDLFFLQSPTPWLNPSSLLPANGGDLPTKPYGSGAGIDTASLFAGLTSAGGGSTREALTVPPTPSSTSVSSFAAQAMMM